MVKVGIFEDFPPFASLGTDMQIQGYDVDMANLIGKALGVKAELVGINGQNRIPYLTEGKVDLLLSIGFSDERAQVVDFTAPYAPYYIVVMGPRDVRSEGPTRPERQNDSGQQGHFGGHGSHQGRPGRRGSAAL